MTINDFSQQVMNPDNKLNHIADIIEELPLAHVPNFQFPISPGKDIGNPEIVAFTMQYVVAYSNCGTAGCVAGVACHAFKHEIDHEGIDVFNVDHAISVLDLNDAEANALLTPLAYSGPYEDVTPKKAALACRRMALHMRAGKQRQKLHSDQLEQLLWS